jgi:hypothetical protein
MFFVSDGETRPIHSHDFCGDERPKQFSPLFDGSRAQVITCFKRCPDDPRPLTSRRQGAM